MNDLFIYTPYVWDGVSGKKNQNFILLEGWTIKIMEPHLK